MILLNFSHPLTADHLAQVVSLTGQAVARVVGVPVEIDSDRDLAEQVAAIVDGIGIAPEEWQPLPLLVNLPGYAPAAAVLLAELHGRIGHFPDVLWLRFVEDSVPVRYEVADVLRLQTVRVSTRRKR